MLVWNSLKRIVFVFGDTVIHVICTRHARDQRGLLYTFRNIAADRTNTGFANTSPPWFSVSGLLIWYTFCVVVFCICFLHPVRGVLSHPFGNVTPPFSECHSTIKHHREAAWGPPPPPPRRRPPPFYDPLHWGLDACEGASRAVQAVRL